MNKITIWVKENIYGIGEASISTYHAILYSDYLFENEIDYFNDIINERIEKSDFYDLMANIATSHGKDLNVLREYKKLLLLDFRADLIKVLHDVEEEEEGELDDHGLTNKDFLMSEIK